MNCDITNSLEANLGQIFSRRTSESSYSEAQVSSKSDYMLTPICFEYEFSGWMVLTYCTF